MVYNIENCVIDYPIWLLNISGRNPKMNKYLFFIATILYTFSYIIFYSAILINFLYLDGNLILFVENCEGFAMLLQIYGKVAVGSYYKTHFLKLINEFQQWSLKNYGDITGKFRNNLENILKQVEHIQKLFTCGIAIACVIMLITPYFSKQFPTGIWNIPGYDVIYTALLIMQEVACPLYVLVAVGVDSLFLGFCGKLIVEYKILQYNFERLGKDGGSYSVNIKSYIKYHDHLLRHTKILAKIYSPIMLLEYFSISLVSFVEMYLIFSSDNLVHFLRGIVFLSGALIQLSFYCIPAQLLITEVKAVGNSVYQSDWPSNMIQSVRNTVCLVLMRSEDQLKFPAGGLVDINPKTLISVLQFAWSVCTLMRGLHNVQH